MPLLADMLKQAQVPPVDKAIALLGRKADEGGDALTGLHDPASRDYAALSAGEAFLRAMRQSYSDKGYADPSYLSPSALKAYASTPVLRRAFESPAHGTLAAQQLWWDLPAEEKSSLKRGAVQLGVGMVAAPLAPIIGGAADAVEGWQDPQKTVERVKGMQTPRYEPVREGSAVDAIKGGRAVFEAALRPSVAARAALTAPKAFADNWRTRLDQAVQSGSSLMGVKAPYEQDEAAAGRAQGPVMDKIDKKLEAIKQVPMEDPAEKDLHQQRREARMAGKPRYRPMPVEEIDKREGWTGDSGAGMGKQAQDSADDKPGRCVKEYKAAPKDNYNGPWKKIGCSEFMKTARDYGWLGIELPKALQSRITALHKDIDSKDLHADGLDTDPHITVAYGVDPGQNPFVIKGLLQARRPVKARLGRIGFFENDGQTVLKFNITSPGLRALNSAIEDEVDLPGNTFKEYRPHVTIAYLKAGTDTGKYKNIGTGLTGTEFEVDAMQYNDAGEKHFEFGLEKAAMISLDIEKGDIILGGRFKNVPHEVKKIGEDELGQPTVNGMKLLSFRIKKKMPKEAALSAVLQKKAQDAKAQVLPGPYHYSSSKPVPKFPVMKFPPLAKWVPDKAFNSSGKEYNKGEASYYDTLPYAYGSESKALQAIKDASAYRKTLNLGEQPKQDISETSLKRKIPIFSSISPFDDNTAAIYDPGSLGDKQGDSIMVNPIGGGALDKRSLKERAMSDWNSRADVPHELGHSTQRSALLSRDAGAAQAASEGPHGLNPFEVEAGLMGARQYLSSQGTPLSSDPTQALEQSRSFLTDLLNDESKLKQLPLDQSQLQETILEIKKLPLDKQKQYMDRMIKLLPAVVNTRQRDPMVKAAEFKPGIADKTDMGDHTKLPLNELLPFIQAVHASRRAGTHNDYRFGQDPMLSFASQKELPEPGEQRAWFQQPAHAQAYSEFEGAMPKGIGSTKIKSRGQVKVTHSEKDLIRLLLLMDDRQRAYTMKRMTEGKPRWLVTNDEPVQKQAQVAGYDPVKSTYDTSAEGRKVYGDKYGLEMLKANRYRKNNNMPALTDKILPVVDSPNASMGKDSIEGSLKIMGPLSDKNVGRMDDEVRRLTPEHTGQMVQMNGYSSLKEMLGAQKNLGWLPHEGLHGREDRLKNTLENKYYKRLAYGATYPSQQPSEFTPVLTAAQRWYYGQTGKRVEKEEDYTDFKDRLFKADYKSLPDEVKRYYNFHKGMNRYSEPGPLKEFEEQSKWRMPGMTERRPPALSDTIVQKQAQAQAAQRHYATTGGANRSLPYQGSLRDAYAPFFALFGGAPAGKTWNRFAGGWDDKAPERVMDTGIVQPKEIQDKRTALIDSSKTWNDRQLAEGRQAPNIKWTGKELKKPLTPELEKVSSLGQVLKTKGFDKGMYTGTQLDAAPDMKNPLESGRNDVLDVAGNTTEAVTQIKDDAEQMQAASRKAQLPKEGQEQLKSTLIGAGVGAGLGGLAGALSSKKNRLRNALIGMAGGGLAGGLAGPHVASMAAKPAAKPAADTPAAPVQPEKKVIPGEARRKMEEYIKDHPDEKAVYEQWLKQYEGDDKAQYASPFEGPASKMLDSADIGAGAAYMGAPALALASKAPLMGGLSKIVGPVATVGGKLFPVLMAADAAKGAMETVFTDKAGDVSMPSGITDISRRMGDRTREHLDKGIPVYDPFNGMMMATSGLYDLASSGVHIARQRLNEKNMEARLDHMISRNSQGRGK